MADAITMSYTSSSETKESDNYPFWNHFPLFDYLYKKGKSPAIITINLTIDTSTADTATESTAPTNVVNNFTTPVQVYAQSSDALDVEKEFYVLGEKSDGSIGVFTFETDDTDGTTAIDLGTWHFIAYAWTTATTAGSITLDNGVATTYFTLLSGASLQTKGILVVPTGYNGTILCGTASLQDVPAANTNGNVLDLAQSWSDILDTDKPVAEFRADRFKCLAHEQERIDLKHFYKTAVTAMKVCAHLIIWEA